MFSTEQQTPPKTYRQLLLAATSLERLDRKPERVEKTRSISRLKPIVISPRMTQLLQGKATAITGAVTGIGRAIAVDYLKHGASVAVNYYPDPKSQKQFEELQKEVGDEARLIGLAGDITKPETGQEFVKKTVEKFGRLDVFVSNAGVCQFADFLT